MEQEMEKGGVLLTRLVPPEQWAVYDPVFAEGARRGISFVIGGGLAVSVYSGHPRNTKDLDLFVRQEQSGALLDMLRGLGFDEYTELPYDRTWSYRAFRQGAIVDVLWKTLNGKSAVDEQWLTEGWEVTVRGTRVRLIPLEELIVSKLYILKPDRTDWPDILNLLYTRVNGLRWSRLLEMLGDDRLLLGGVMSVFRWLCPGRAALVPAHLWEQLGLPPPHFGPPADQDKIALLAAGQWFCGAES
ncbi:hypothetical protein GSbR_22200 [Geobacter sp. SVR]|nr:hypothetical protein GSbR_22200 [Geobacter sp. SVR]